MIDGDKMILGCHVISQNHVIKISYHPAVCGGYRHSGSGDMCLVRHMILT